MSALQPPRKAKAKESNVQNVVDLIERANVISNESRRRRQCFRVLCELWIIEMPFSYPEHFLSFHVSSFVINGNRSQIKISYRHLHT